MVQPVWQRSRRFVAILKTAIGYSSMTSAFSSMLALQSLLPELLTSYKQFHRSHFFSFFHFMQISSVLSLFACFHLVAYLVGSDAPRGPTESLF